MENNATDLHLLDFAKKRKSLGQPPASEASEAPPMQVTEVISNLQEVEPEKLLSRLPKYDYEVEGEIVHHWHVKQWSSSGVKVNGPVFRCGTAEFNILLFPNGNNQNEFCSLYLAAQKPADAPHNWHVCAVFILYLSNPNDPTVFQHSVATHRFTSDEVDWGFTKFASLKDLFRRHPDQARPLVEDNQALITCAVRVYKDPTGVLWHNFLNYDSKLETGFVGLKNQGATCYMNSLLQSLFLTNQFRKAVFQIPTDKDVPTSSIALALQRLFHLLQTSPKAVDTAELTKSFGWDLTDAFMQHDVQEFNRILQDNLEQKMKNTPAEGAIEGLFLGERKSYIKCINVDYESVKVDKYYDIQLCVEGCKDLRESFLMEIQEETLEGENKYFADKHGLQDAKKGERFKSFPPVLHIQLRRFKYSAEMDSMVKINDRHEFPLEIDLEEFLSDDADKSQSYVYKLHGVLVHSGDTHGGHYHALLKPEKDSRWFKFDDDRVTPVALNEVLDENYGGTPHTEPMGPRPGGRLSQNVKTWKRYTNAYMLVYIRETEIDKVLSPVNEDDVPRHVVETLAEEQVKKEKEMKEHEERMHSLQVRIVTDDMMLQYRGFDLFDFADTKLRQQHPSFQVRKDLPFSAFYLEVGRRFNLKPNQFRLWTFVNRQNKTIRPDIPLSPKEEYESKSMEFIKSKVFLKFPELRFYLEANLEAKELPPILAQQNISSPNALIFIKYFDLHAQKMEYKGKLYIQRIQKIEEILPYLCEFAGFPTNTKLKLFEEIKPSMIEPLSVKKTFAEAELQGGDIICFQKEPTEKDIQELKPNAIVSVKGYFEYVQNAIHVLFRPKHPSAEQTEFELKLNKKMEYDEVANRVAEKLGVPPIRLCFSPQTATGLQPANPIKRNPTYTILDMLNTGYYSHVNVMVLYYEVLDFDITELESKVAIKIIWLTKKLKVEKEIKLLLLNESTFEEVEKQLSEQLGLKEGQKIRFWECIHSRTTEAELIPLDRPLSKIRNQVQIYAEEVPEEEAESREDFLVMVHHFQKEIPRFHGIPFPFKLQADWEFSQVKKLLQERLDLPDKDWSKVKLAQIAAQTTYQQQRREPRYLEDTETPTSVGWNFGDILGLDHPDRSMVGRGEKAIKIFN